MSSAYTDRVKSVWHGSRLPYEQIVADADYLAMAEYMRLGRSPEDDRPASLRVTLGRLADYAMILEDRRRRMAAGRLFESGAVRFAIADKMNMLLDDGAGSTVAVGGPAIKMHLTGSSLYMRQILSDLGGMQAIISQSGVELPSQMTAVTHRDLAMQTARFFDTQALRVVAGIDPLVEQSMLISADAARLINRRPVSSDRNIYMATIATEDFLDRDFSRYRHRGDLSA